MVDKKPREITEEIKQELRKKAERLMEQHNVGGEGGGVEALSQRLEELYAEGYEVLEETKSVPYLHWEDGKWELKKEFLDKDWKDNDRFLFLKK